MAVQYQYIHRKAHAKPDLSFSRNKQVSFVERFIKLNEASGRYLPRLVEKRYYLK